MITEQVGSQSKKKIQTYETLTILSSCIGIIGFIHISVRLVYGKNVLFYEARKGIFLDS